MKDHLLFDTTDATSIKDSDSVGAFLRDAAGNLITSQANGSQRALDVGINVAGVQIDPRDIRALTNADVVTAEQGTSPWVVSLASTTITGTVAVTQSTSPWVVSATDLDIRNLDYTLDNVAIKGATGNELVVNADGSINVQADISITTGSDKAEDAAAASGDIGTYVLGVRQDTLASSTSTDGDYASFKMSAAGALYVNVAESSVALTVSDAALANTAMVSNTNTLAVAATAQVAVATPLAARKYLFLYNFSNKQIFVGGSALTAANGYPVSPGSAMELRAGVASPVYFVGQAGQTPEIRTLEAS